MICLSFLKPVRLFFIIFIVFLALPNVVIFADAADAAKKAQAEIDKDPVRKVLCNVIDFVKKLGLPIMTGVIIGSSVLAIFGRLAWPAIVMLVVFTAIFFGAGQVITKFSQNVVDSAYACS